MLFSPKPQTGKRHAWMVGVLLLLVTFSCMAQTLPLAKVWKDPSCGCCEDWIAHLKAAGFKVQTFDTGNADARARLGIPRKYGSCHTAEIGGYAIEGHVPAADIKRLLKEAPKGVVGLAVPGMVIGSPGMDGAAYGGRKEPYDVLLINKDGSSRVYQSYR